MPFPSLNIENITFSRGGKRTGRARRGSALKDVSNGPPVVTILKRPNPTPPAPQQPVPAPPPVTILKNPKRQAEIARSAQAPPQDASPAPLPKSKARTSAHVSFAFVVPEDNSSHYRGCIRTARPVPRTGFVPERMVRLPKVVVHEPVWWDEWTDVHHPGTSSGELLNVPTVNWRGKLDAADFARFYPKEWFAEQMARRLNELERSELATLRAAVRRRESLRQRVRRGYPLPTDTNPPRMAPPITNPTPTEPPSLYFI